MMTGIIKSSAAKGINAAFLHAFTLLEDRKVLGHRVTLVLIGQAHIVGFIHKGPIQRMDY